MPILINKFSTVVGSLHGNDIMTYPVYRCKQMFANVVSQSVVCMWPSEFSCEKFNLRTSRICQFVNGPFDKCINLYIECNDEKIEVNAVNVEKFELYKSVKCLLCDTAVGVIYKFASVAILYNMDIDATFLRGTDCPLIILTEEEKETHRGFLMQRFNEEILPDTVTEATVNQVRQFTITNRKWARNNRKFFEIKGLPYLDRFLYYPEFPPDEFVSFF